MHTHTITPQGRPLAPFAYAAAATAPRPRLSAVLDALRAEDEQTRRDAARFAEIIARLSGARS